MMKLDLYQIDAFANKIFEGNPAAVCPLGEWLSDDLMQQISAENNLSETAFFIKANSGYHIRWFTPVREVDLCGHATLASAFVIFNMLLEDSNECVSEVCFESKSGLLTVTQNGSWLEMNFPSEPATVCPIPKEIIQAFEAPPIVCLKSIDYIVVFENESQIVNAKPDLRLLSELDLRGVVITSQATQFDFIARCFAPKYGIDEDPVTGSAYTQLMPYWAAELEKTDLNARQVSHRGGEVKCKLVGDRVFISGTAVQYMVGEIYI